MSAFHYRQTSGGFVERTIEDLRSALDRAIYADNSARQRGLLQPLDPRVKVAGLLAWIVSASLASRLWVIALLLLAGLLLASASSISLRAILRQVLFATFAFSAALAIPALFLTPGSVLYTVPGLHWNITRQGLTTASFLVLRAETSATLGLLLVFTTPWNHILKALRLFRVPVVLVVILGMACRYILLLLETAHQMFESRKSRTVGSLTRLEQRQLAVSGAGVLLNQSVRLSGEVYLAMQARGFRGELYLLDDFRMQSRDWIALALFFAFSLSVLLAGR